MKTTAWAEEEKGISPTNRIKPLLKFSAQLDKETAPSTELLGNAFKSPAPKRSEFDEKVIKQFEERLNKNIEGASAQLKILQAGKGADDGAKDSLTPAEKSIAAMDAARERLDEAQAKAEKTLSGAVSAERKAYKVFRSSGSPTEWFKGVPRCH